MDQPDPASVATLTASGGLLDGTEYAVVDRGRPVVIGSSMDADIQILLGNVEAAHACITVSPAGLTLSDVGSATGTFVNGDPIETDQPLHDGDEISLGNPGAKGTARLLLRLRKTTAAAHASPSLGHTGPPPALEAHGLAPVLEDTPAPAFVSSSAKGLAAVGPQPHQTVAPADSPKGLAPVEATPVVSAKGLAPFEERPADQPIALRPLDERPKPDTTLPMPRPAPRAAPRPAPAPVKPQATLTPSRPVAAPPKPASAAGPPPPPPPARTEAAPQPSKPAPPGVAGHAKPTPQYHADLPSVPPPTEGEPASAPLPLNYPPGFPPLRPPPPASPRPARRRGFSVPSLPLVPIAAGLAVLVVLGLAAVTWRSLSRTRPPQLLSIAPVRTRAGQTLTLTGSDFARDPAANTVLFGAARAAVTTASGTELKVVVPAGAKAVVPVVVETRGGRSQPVSVTIEAPVEVTALDPEVAVPGQRILVRTAGLSGQKISVEVAGLASPSVEAAAEGVRAVVPEIGLPEGSRTSVVVRAGEGPARSFELLIGRLPLVLGVVPAAGPVGEVVTLDGRGFDPDPALNAVSFGGEPALVLSASRTALKVVVPASSAGDALPELPVVVKALGRTSSPRVSFRLVRGGTSSFRPRFFPAPVSDYPGEALAFVSSELGPVLLLGGPGESGSVGERAMAVSAALNALVDSSTGAPVLEVRTSPPALAVAGSPRPLLTPTPQDLAAYAKPWDGGRAGATRRVSAPALVRHWAALLQDYLGLFLVRQRPVQMLALSPRGRVFAEIYAEANRRAPGEPAVPSRLVLPTPTGWASGLRQAALVVAEDGGRSAAAVVEGSWQGQIDDPELGPRRFRVQLRLDGGKLAGSLTTWAGSLELRAPLRELQFDKDKLRFTADLQGAAYRFSATLQGDRMGGTIERPSRPALPFTMQFVE